jgi:hypothetical protein
MRRAFLNPRPAALAAPVSRAALVALALALASCGCARSATDDTAPAAAGAAVGAATAAEPKPVPVRVLAESANPGSPLIVQVLEAKRATPDTVRVELAFINKSPTQSQDSPAQAPPPLPLLRALAAAPAGVPAGGAAAGASAEANPADFCLITADGARRLFLLRDAQDKPVLEGDWRPLRPGERRVVQAMFPAPPAAPTGRVTVSIVLGRVLLRDVPIS